MGNKKCAGESQRLILSIVAEEFLAQYFESCYKFSVAHFE